MMNTIQLTLLAALAAFSCPAAEADGLGQAPLPALSRDGGRTTMMVDGRPFTMLAGELHNSSTGSAAYMAPIWERLAAKNINTALAVVSWELTEPEEGRFDFHLVDSLISGVRRAGLKVGLLWFGSWKNGVSTYAPAWVKTDTRRFPLGRFRDGQTMNTLSPLGRNTMEADAKAFAALMRHIRETDTLHTVIMVQVENEMGMLDSASTFSGSDNRSQRDYSPLAERAFKGQVPAALTAYLKRCGGMLHKAVREAWERGGWRMSGTWEEVFGKGRPSSGTDKWADEYPYLTEELFMAWHYASYVETVARAGKAELPLPMYVNAWLKQKDGREPGRYPSGGPLPHVFDIWRAAAPSVDFFAPDIYAVDRFDETCREYSSGGNPLIIPETPADAAGAARAFYAFGRYGALCYSPFGIDGHGLMLSADGGDKSYDRAYGLLRHLLHLAQSHKTYGLMTNGERTEDSLTLGDCLISMAPFSAARAFAVAGVVAKDNPGRKTDDVAGLMIIETGKDEFILAGFGDQMIGIAKSRACRADNIGLLSVDEMTWDADGKLSLRRLNGDETALGGAVIGAGEARAYKVRIYRY